MCGIAGIWGTSIAGSLERMVAAMYHRGPDDFGIMKDRTCALGMARLAIIDVSTSGHQPMCTPDSAIRIVYNGEMYNFREERALLEKKGIRFTSSSDTEVLLRMYEAYGDEFLTRVRGMFAIAIYDKRRGEGRERLLLARDQFGIKPLVYARSGSAFLFASEIKALLAGGMVEPEIEPEAIRLLLTNGSILQPLTAIRGARMLLPGHIMIIEKGIEKSIPFWKLDAGRQHELERLPYHEQVRTVRKCLEACVRLQMVSDVPLGAFLSGGIDSSLLVALMAQFSGQRVKTFSVGFGNEGSDIDEAAAAERIARIIGTDHSAVMVSGSQVRDSIMHIAAALDQPSVDGVNSYFVSRAARQAVTVAISGTGGDELFAGYPWFAAMVAAENRSRKSSLLRGIRQGFAVAARSSLLDRFVKGKSGWLIDAMRASGGFLPHYARMHQIFGAPGAHDLISDRLRYATRAGREASKDILPTDELASSQVIDRVSALCLRGYTQNQLLRDIDAVSMAHSLEIRVPFLDPEVADLALSLPPATKLAGNFGDRPDINASYDATGAKRILIDVRKDLVRDNAAGEAKKGFGMPFEVWLRKDLKDIMEETLSEGVVRNRGFFSAKITSSVRDDFLAGRIHWSRPWLLMMTELWARAVLDRDVRA